MAPRASFLVLFVLTALIPASGCNIVGPLAYLAHGPEKVPRVHTLQKDRPTVVFVDDRANVMPRRQLRYDLAQACQQALLDKGSLTNVIDARTAMQVAQQERYGEPMTIVDIGRAVEASVVLFVTVDSFTLSADGQSFVPEANLRVKLIDVESEERLWPAEYEGFELPARGRIQPGYAPSDTSSRVRAEQELAARAGVATAELFYDTDVTTSVRAAQGF